MKNTRRSKLESIIGAYEQGLTSAVVTVIGDGWHEKFILDESDGTEFWRAEAERLARETLSSRAETALATVTAPDGAQVRVAVETIRPKTALVVFGAGHVGQAVALMGAMLGYTVTVIDDRQEFVSRERFPNPDIRLVALPFNEATRTIPISANTAIVIVTRGHSYDEESLKGVVNSPAGYIGMIGSRRRVIAVYDRLTREGISPDALAKVHAPIGRRIGARSPQEIAVAILAEIVQTMSSVPAQRSKRQ